MEHFKGTKGNWEYIGRRIGVNLGDEMEAVVIAGLFGSGEETTANAKLIAAAPDLLESLQEIMRFKAELRYVMTTQLSFPDNFLKSINNAESALKKVLV